MLRTPRMMVTGGIVFNSGNRNAIIVPILVGPNASIIINVRSRVSMKNASKK
jgi:hypothetical protein